MATGVSNVPQPPDDDEKSSETVKVASGASPKTLPTPTSNTTSAAGDNLYFYEDEIFRIDKKGRVKFGLVIETCETYSADEDDEYDDVPSKGEVRIAWYPDNREELHSERAIGLVDRTLMPGDVVRRLSPGKNTQRGYCREINMCADVKVLGTKYVIKNVMAERLRLIAYGQRDSPVCLDSWVGSTKYIEATAVLKHVSGARIEIPSSLFYIFRDLNSRYMRGMFSPQFFYPGNVVVGRLTSMEKVKLLTPSIPLPTNKKGKSLTFTVESVNMDSVWVHWQCKALSEEASILTSALTEPHPCVTGEDLKRLKRLNLFDSLMLQITDRNYLKYSQCDTIIKKSQWDKEQAVKFKAILSQQQKEEHLNLFVFTGNGHGSANNTTPHFDKIRKKQNLLDAEKSTAGKSKKFVLKVEKQSKEKNQNHNNSGDFTWKSGNNAENDWVSDDDADNNCEHHAEDEKNDDTDGTINLNEDGISTISSCSSPSPRCSPKHHSFYQFKKKARPLKKPSKIRPRSATPDFMPKEGDELVTEALLVYSTATVVWQDGTVDHDIPSTQLYPIHHLDNHEFFPGDFVISGKEDSDVSFRDYGVIQTVDHQGRTAHVKWFTTYTSADAPKPTYKGESEVSVYDLNDHPDFQYRPGTMVIRVANFVGEDASCTAGQIIDNFIDGMIKVWWVDGHISMCWPQDLFEVGQYEGQYEGNGSEDSWETESENSELGDGSPKLTFSESHILANIERARVAIARLEEIFNINPNLQNSEVMRKLLTVYKGCRHLDRLLNTTFFDEEHFMGLVERVRKGGTQSISERAQDRKNRLFSDGPPTSPNPKMQQQQPQQHLPQCHYQAIVAVNSSQKLHHSSVHSSSGAVGTTSTKEYAPKVLFNISSTPFKCTPSSSSLGAGSANNSNAPPPAYKRKCSPVATARNDAAASAANDKNIEVPTSLYNLLTTQSAPNTSTTSSHSPRTPNTSLSLPEAPPSNNRQYAYNVEKNQLLSSVILNVEKVFGLKTNMIAASSQDDSGNFSRNENCDGSSTSYASSSDLTNVDANCSLIKVNDDQKSSVSCSSIELTEDASPELVCVRLCTLLKDQLVKCLNEIREKYYKDNNLNLGDVYDYDAVEEETSETIIEANENVKDADADDDGIDKEKIISEDTNEAKSPLASPVDDRITTTQSKNAVSTTPTSTSTATENCAMALSVPLECFQLLPIAPKTHKFHLTIFHPNNTQLYYRAVQREHRMLKSALPPGVWVKVFEDRMDLLSVMIEGPKNTPYEDGMFFFDIQLGREYPKSPPLCHYISYCSDRLNPNLYEDGKVCVSLLGTWSGRDSEVWGSNSTLLQVIVSIQGLILVPEPYFNEAGYEKQKGSQQGKENSRMYNEMVIIKMVQATTKLLQHQPELFSQEVLEHFRQNGLSMYERIKGWMELSKQETPNTNAEQIKTIEPVAAATYALPDFPLVPASRGFCLTLAGLLDTFKCKLENLSAAASSETSSASATNVLVHSKE